MSKTIPTTIHELAAQVSASDINSRSREYFEPEAVQSVLDDLNHMEIDSDQDDSLFEMCDSLVDVYNSDLLEWVSKYDHDGYVQEAISSGIADQSDFYRTLMAGQYEWYRTIAQACLDSLEEILQEMYEEGILVSAMYLTDDGFEGEDPVDKETLEGNVAVTVEQEEGGGLFTVSADPDDAEFIFDTHTDDEGREFTVAARDSEEE